MVAGLLESELPYIQAPGIAAPPDAPRFVTAAPPTIADASLCVTSLQASTLAILVSFGDGVGLLADEVDGEFDPHAPTNRPANTTAASTPLVRMARITRLSINPLGISGQSPRSCGEGLRTSKALGGCRRPRQVRFLAARWLPTGAAADMRRRHSPRPSTQ